MPDTLIPSDAVKAIQESVKTETIVVDETVYVTRQVYLPPPEPVPVTLHVHTLSGLIEFIEHERKQGDIATIHVADYKTVRVHGELLGRYARRVVYAQADLIGAPAFPYGHWLDAETFIIKAQTCFVPTSDLAGLLAIVGNLKDEDVKTAIDDGISQKVTTKKGISLGVETQVPNPVRLVPYRTFAELTQPASLFILRLRRVEGALPHIALWEVGDLAWQPEAIERIANFIKSSVEGIPVIA